MDYDDPNAVVKQWAPLVTHIINRYYAWAVIDVGTGSYEKMRRAVDNEDLQQVGVMALIQASASYRDKHYSKASFKTYAFRVIYNTLLNYIGSNSTPITVPSQRNVQKSNNEKNKLKLKSATNYLCFSELWPEAYTSRGPNIESLIDTKVESPAVIAEKVDFHTSCIDKLKNSLSAEEYRILILRYNGLTYTTIGEKVGLSYQSISNILEQLNYKCRHILLKETEEFGNGSEDNKSLACKT